MDLYTAALVQGLAFSMLSMGIYITLKIFSIPDITTDGSYTLGAAITAVLLGLNFNPFISLLTCLVAGAIAGYITGLIHTRLKVQALLAGILTMTALYSINLAIMGRSNISLRKAETILDYFAFVEDSLLRSLIVMLIFTVLCMLILNYLLRTDFGIAMRVTGDSPSMAEAMGVNTVRMKVIGLAIANAFTALSAYLITQYQGFADINMGIGIVISGLAAVIIGESVIGLFKNSSILMQLVAVVIGTIVFRVAIALALDLGLNPIYLKLMTALIVLLIVSLSFLEKKKHD